MNEINSKSFKINIDKPTIADLEVYFQKHSASLDALRQSMQKATEKIIDLKGNKTATSLKELLDKDIQNVSDSVSNLEDNMNTSFRDGVITEAECISIKNSLSRLDTEKADIDKNYENLYNNVNLNGVAKTNLNSTYTAYVSIHTELVNYVNGVMVDNTATTEEVAEVKNKLNRYNVALSNYKVAQNVAVNSIAEVVSNNNLAEYKTLVNKDINDINKKINDMTTDIGSVVVDGVIDEAEAMILANNIIELNKEKADIDARYNNVYNNPNLKGTVKSNLKTRYDNFCLSHNSLIETINNVIEDNVATESEKVDLQTALDDYSSNLSLLSVSFDEAFKSISEAIANSVSEELRKELQGNINDVAESVQNLNTYIDGAFKDSVLTDSEKESIRTYLKTLATEKADIDNQYNTLYNNSDLLGTAKSNLKTSYDNYVAKYNILISTINTILTYTEITSANKTKLDNDFREHDRALATYSQRVNEAINAIAEKKKEDAKSYTDTQFNVLEDRIELRVTSKEMKEYVGTVSSGLQSQIDGKIETYYQTTDPSVDWTTSELKTQHKGDIWYDSLNNITYRWGGITWVKITDADAETAKALAISKAKIFTSQPNTPYYKGDLWVQGSSGDIMECIYTRTSGNYSSSDWAKASKYTDDTAAKNVANNLANNYYTIEQTNSAINVAKESIELGVSKEVENIYESIDNIDGRNLIRNSAFVNGTICWNLGANVTLDTSRTFNEHPSVKNSQSGLTNDKWVGCTNSHLPIANPLTANQTYTLSCYYYIENTSTFDSDLGFEVKGVKVGATTQSSICSIVVSRAKLVSNKWTRVSGTFTLTEKYSSTFVYAWVRKNGTVWFTDFKLEKGSKYTDWSAAPEDSQDYTESKIKIASDNITNKVSGIYATKDSLGNVENRVSTAEQEITPEAIVNKVNTVINNNGAISTTYTTLDKNGFTVYNGAIYVKNSKGENVLWGDTNGNLQAKGKITTINNNGYLNLEGNKLQGYVTGKSYPMYSSGMWYPDNGNTLSGFVSVSNGNSLLGDNEGCLYMSGWSETRDTNKKAVLQYSRNEGAYTSLLEFSKTGSVSMISRSKDEDGGAGIFYGIWNSPDGYIYPYRGNEYIGSQGKPWAKMYVKEMLYTSAGYFSAPKASSLLSTVSDDDVKPLSVDSVPTTKDFVDFVESLEFGIYKEEDNGEEIKPFSEEECNLNFMPIINKEIESFSLEDNPAKSLVVQTVTDKEGKESQQVINLMGYCTTLAITIQELIKENKELKNEIIEIKNRLNNIEK